MLHGTTPFPVRMDGAPEMACDAMDSPWHARKPAASLVFTSIVVCLTSSSTHRASTTSTWSHLGHNTQVRRNELLPVQHLQLMRYIRVIGWLPAPSRPAPLRPCALTLSEFLFEYLQHRLHK